MGLFNSKDSKKTTEVYNEVNAAGTASLRNLITTKIFSGDEYIVDKLTQSYLYWNFYLNQHWKENNDRLLSFNYCRAFIDKVNRFLAGKNGFETNIEDYYGEDIPEDIEKNFEALINYNWSKNNKGLKVTTILQMGGITGDAYIFLSVNKDKKYVEYKVLDTRTVVPIFKDGDKINLIAIRVIEQLNFNEKAYVVKVTEYDKDKQTTYFTKSTDANADKYEFKEEKHDFGELPVVHIRNFPIGDYFHGHSDIADIVKINKIYNEMSEELKAIVDYYSKPVTVITGAQVGNLRRGIGEIWSGLPQGASVQNLSLNEDLSSSSAFLGVLKGAMHDISHVPENVLGKTQFVSNTSAAALQILYHPLIEAADTKWLMYGEGIEKINEMTVKMYNKYLSDFPLATKLKNVDMTRYVAKPMFKYGLPSDRLIMLQEAVLELNAGIGSKKEIMDRLGKKNIPKINEEIKQDQAETLKQQQEAANIFSGQQPQPTQQNIKIPQEKLLNS